MPTECRVLLELKKPVTPTTAFNFSNASVFAGSSRSRLLLPIAVLIAGGSALLSTLNPSASAARGLKPPPTPPNRDPSIASCSRNVAPQKDSSPNVSNRNVCRPFRMASVAWLTIDDVVPVAAIEDVLSWAMACLVAPNEATRMAINANVTLTPTSCVVRIRLCTSRLLNGPGMDAGARANREPDAPPQTMRAFEFRGGQLLKRGGRLPIKGMRERAPPKNNIRAPSTTANLGLACDVDPDAANRRPPRPSVEHVFTYSRFANARSKRAAS